MQLAVATALFLQLRVVATESMWKINPFRGRLISGRENRQQ